MKTLFRFLLFRCDGTGLILRSAFLCLLGILPCRAEVTPDNYDVLLLKCDGTNNQFVDSSTANPKAVTANGNATQLPIKFNRTAGFFNGTTDYVQLPSSNDYTFASDFSVETFINFTSLPVSGTVIELGSLAANKGLRLYYASGAGWIVYINGSNLQGGYIPHTPALNTWHHLMIVRTSGTVRLFVNGTQFGNTWSNSDTVDSSTYGGTIGAAYGGAAASFCSCWMKELRISNVARTITVPTNQYTPDANTRLLMHFDSPATSPIGPAISITGGSADQVLIAPSTDFNFGTNDFTIEGFFRAKDANGFAFWFIGQDNAPGQVGITYNSSYPNRFILYLGGYANFVGIPGITPQVGVWYHVAFCRYGGSMKTYINGILLGNDGGALGNITTGSTYGISIASENPARAAGKCYVREFRVSNVARYTANFVPPQKGYIVDSNVKAYIKGHENNGATTISDYETIPKSITVGGNVCIAFTEDYRSCIFKDETGKTPYPQGSAKVDFFAIGQGVGYFDGTNSKLTVQSSSDYNFNATNFTIEGYVRFDSTGTTYLIIGTDGYPLGVYLNEAPGIMSLYLGSRNAWDIAVSTKGSVNLLAKTWYHWALVYTGTNYKTYINGTDDITIPISTSLSGNQGTSIDIGGSSFFKGLMDNIRISKGIARYTNTFNPPEDVVASTYAVSPTNSLTFGVVPIGASQTLAFQLTMTGSQPVTGTASTVSPFAIQSGSPFTIATGGVATVYVSFSPTNAGFFTNTVTFTSSAGIVTRTVTGQGVLDLSDNDGDGIPNYWEIFYGLNPTNAADANLYPVVGGVTNKLTYLQIYRLGLDPRTLDCDQDGLTDYDELFVTGTDPFKADADGDGIPDGWEISHGLSPRVNDANDDLDRDGLSNLAEYTWSLTHTNQPLDPSRAYSLGGLVGDYQIATGILTNRFYYDKNDRLIGGEYANGLTIAYVYDGNNNLLRQVYGSRQTETSPLPLSWLAKYGLTGTNAATANGAYDDPDCDGWSNYQEWRAGSNPADPLSVPTNAPQTAPLAAVIPTTNVMGALALVPIRLWDNEGNASLPFLQYSNRSVARWSNATILKVDGTNYSSSLRVAALPTGSDHVLTWFALQDLGSVRTNVFLRAQAMDMTLNTNWSAPVEYQVDTFDANHNSIPDSWELQYFGYVGVDLNADPDHDGFNNWQEYIADTNPTNAASCLRITSASRATNGVQITWSAGVQARQYVQRTDGLRGTNVWVSLQTNQPPTPISGSYLDILATNNANFYRIRVERP